MSTYNWTCSNRDCCWVNDERAGDVFVCGVCELPRARELRTSQRVLDVVGVGAGDSDSWCTPWINKKRQISRSQSQSQSQSQAVTYDSKDRQFKRSQPRTSNDDDAAFIFEYIQGDTSTDSNLNSAKKSTDSSNTALYSNNHNSNSSKRTLRVDIKHSSGSKRRGKSPAPQHQELSQSKVPMDVDNEEDEETKQQCGDGQASNSFQLISMNNHVSCRNMELSSLRISKINRIKKRLNKRKQLLVKRTERKQRKSGQKRSRKELPILKEEEEYNGWYAPPRSKKQRTC